MPRALLVVGYIIAWPALAAVVLTRQSGIPAIHTIWAEDGLVFYQQALTRSFPSTLIALDRGYIQLFPRLAMGGLARLVPVRDAATAISVVGAMSVAAVALLVFHASRGLIPSVFGRCVLAAAILLLPIATGELLDNIVNVSWWLFIACFWALLWRPTSVAGRLVACVTCLLCTASDPAALIFLPIVLARLLALPRIREQAATIGYFAGLSLELLAMTLGGANSVDQHSWGGVFELLSIRVWLGALFGPHPTDWLIAHAWTVSMMLGVLVIAVVVVLAMAQPNKGVRLLAVFAIGIGAFLFVAQVWIRGVAPIMLHVGVITGSRYAAAPILLVLSVAIASVSRFRGWGGKGALVACCLVLALGWALGFRAENARSSGPNWEHQVSIALARCLKSGHTSETVAIDPPGWTVNIPCRSLMTPRHR